MKLEYNISTRKKDKGHQVIVSYKENGKWKQKSKQGFKSQREARLYGNELVDKIREKENLGTPVELKGITLGGFVEIFLEDKYYTCEASTIYRYSSACKQLINLYDKKLENITYLDLVNVFNNMKDKYSPHTIKSNYRHLNVLFKAAVKPYKIIKENPLSDLKLNIKTKNEIKVLDKSTLIELVKNMESQRREYYVMTAIGAYTGLRIGEVLGLTWDDIDLKDCTISVNKQWSMRKDKTYGFKKTKTTNSNRNLHFPIVLKTILINYKNDNPIHFSKRLFHVFNHTSATPGRIATVYRNLGYDITFHGLRHSYATILLAEGTDIKTVAALLGDSVEIVIRTYIHYTDEMREKAKEKIQSIF